MNYFITKKFDSDSYILSSPLLEDMFIISENSARFILTEQEFNKAKKDYTINLEEYRVERAFKDYPELFI